MEGHEVSFPFQKLRLWTPN